MELHIDLLLAVLVAATIDRSKKLFKRTVLAPESFNQVFVLKFVLDVILVRASFIIVRLPVFALELVDYLDKLTVFKHLSPVVLV